MANKKTFAFSNANRVWTSRYSYTPTCYACIDDEFLSCPQATKRDKLIYEHEKGAGYNNFYDTLYTSYIAVSSNQDPSKEKIFKSVSLETNEGNWSAVLMTNDDAVNDVYFKIQQSFIPSFISKESNKYAYVPPSIRNSTRNVNFYLSASNNQLLENSYDYETLAGLTTILSFFISNYLDGNGPRYAELFSINSFTLSSNSGQNGGKFLFAKASEPSSIKTAYMVPTSVDEDSGFSGSIEVSDFFSAISGDVMPLQINVDDSNAAVRVDISMVLNYIASQNDVDLSDTANVSTDFIDYCALAIAELTLSIPESVVDAVQYNIGELVNIYSLTDPAIDGDSMRGKYMNILLSVENPDKPFELYAINTEYAHSVLDSSLGQNS